MKDRPTLSKLGTTWNLGKRATRESEFRGYKFPAIAFNGYKEARLRSARYTPSMAASCHLLVALTSWPFFCFGASIQHTSTTKIVAGRWVSRESDRKIFNPTSPWPRSIHLSTVLST